MGGGGRPTVNVHAQNFKPFSPPVHVPARLRDQLNWIIWRLFLKPGKLKYDKLPICVRTISGDGHPYPKNHVSYAEAVAAVERLGANGVGFYLMPSCELTAIDLDRCRNPLTGKIEKWAQDILAFAETYAEVTPSGTGVRLWALGRLPGGRACVFHDAQVEMYSVSRFMTFTGEHIKGAPLELQAAPGRSRR